MRPIPTTIKTRSATIVIFAYLLHSASALPIDASALESSISALEKDIEALESSSVPLEHLLPWLAAVVAVGVAMEFWVIWRARRDNLVAFGRGIVCPPDRPSTAHFIVEITSVLLVTAGIVGELWVGVKIASMNGQLRSKGAELRSKSDQLLEFVRKEAGDAQLNAGLAMEKTAKIGQENLKLQKGLTNRRITQRQHDILVDLLSQHKGHLILESMSDSEAGLFASDILKTFKEDAKWDVETQLPLGVIWTGLIVAPSSDPDALVAVQALQAAGIPFSVGTIPAAKATIIVGGRPPIFLPKGPLGKTAPPAAEDRKTQKANNHTAKP